MAFYRALRMFDKVCESEFRDFDPYEQAATCLYLSSKQNDEKYLLMSMYVRGCNLTAGASR